MLSRASSSKTCCDTATFCSLSNTSNDATCCARVTHRAACFIVAEDMPESGNPEQQRPWTLPCAPRHRPLFFSRPLAAISSPTSTHYRGRSSPSIQNTNLTVPELFPISWLSNSLYSLLASCLRTHTHTHALSPSPYAGSCKRRLLGSYRMVLLLSCMSSDLFALTVFRDPALQTSFVPCPY